METTDPDTTDLLAKAMCEAFYQQSLWDGFGSSGRDHWRRAAKAAMDLMQKREDAQ